MHIFYSQMGEWYATKFHKYPSLFRGQPCLAYICLCSCILLYAYYIRVSYIRVLRVYSFIFVCICVYSLILVYRYVSIHEFTQVREYRGAFVSIGEIAYIRVHSCTFVCIHARVYSCTFVCTHVYSQCSPTHEYSPILAYSRILAYTRLYSPILAYTRVYSRILVYTHVSIREYRRVQASIGEYRRVQAKKRYYT